MADRRDRAAASVDAAPARAALAALLAGTEGAVSFYWPIRSEIDPRPVMEDLARRGRRLCLPVTRRDAPLRFRAWAPGAEMMRDAFGVSYPAVPEEVVPEVLVVPLLAFDRRCHRIGYGAGHYDRTLAGLPGALSIGFAYAAQEVEGEIPVEPTDVALDHIVTERETISR